MDESAVNRYIIDTFPDVETAGNFGYTFFYYKSDHILPFATIAGSDNEYEQVSNLDRLGVFRLNIGVGKQTFQDLFGTAPVDVKSYDFTALDTIMPHPDYANQHFLCVLSPGDETFRRVEPMIAEAYDIAKARFERRTKNSTS